jgi:hypothetical protein
MQTPNQTNLKSFKETPGAISVCEAIAIFNIALQAPVGVYCECGTHAGKSAQAAAWGLERGKFYLIDPCFDLDNREAWSHSVQKTPENMPWSYVAKEDFREVVKNKVMAAGNSRLTPVLIGDYSENFLPKHEGYSYVFIDSDDHCGGMAIREAKLIEDKMVQGGIIAFHDYLNQFSDPAAAYDYLLSTGKYEPIHIDWEGIFNYVRDNNLEAGNNSWHEAGSNEFPRYVGAVKRK